MRIGIIGGGPSGIIAAIEASKRFSDVTILDNNPFLGRKLSVTGAGRCNLTNLHVSESRYHSIQDFNFGKIIEKYDYNFLTGLFNDLGIYTYHTDDGWVYPLSNSAKNIASFLEEALEKRGVKIINNTEIADIKMNDSEYVLFTKSGKEIHFEKIIIATGGKAYPQLNASDNILTSLKNLGHSILPSFPALAPILTSKNETKSLTGVRVDAATRISNNNEVIGEEFGNIIFTDWGINGPGVMNLSHLVHKFKGQLKVQIDFSDALPGNFLTKTIANKDQFFSLASPLLPVLNKKVIDSVFLKLDLQPGLTFSVKQFTNVVDKLRFVENIEGTRDFEFSQISTGAVDSSQIHPDTLESRICPGMFFAGEVLDVFGPCGGYNLHWAFVSGFVAGSSIR